MTGLLPLPLLGPPSARTSATRYQSPNCDAMILITLGVLLVAMALYLPASEEITSLMLIVGMVLIVLGLLRAWRMR